MLIDREFRRRKPRECTACYVPLPYRVDRAEDQAANWELLVPTSCAWGCDMLLDEIVGQFQDLYDLARETPRDNER